MSFTEKEIIKSRSLFPFSLNGLAILTIPSWFVRYKLTVEHACRICRIWLLSKTQIFLKWTLYSAVCHMEQHRLVFVYQSPPVLKKNDGKWSSLSTMWKLTMSSPTLNTGHNQGSSQELEDCWSFRSMLLSSSFFTVLILSQLLYTPLAVNMNICDSFHKYSGFSAARHFRIWRVVWSTTPSSRVAGIGFSYLTPHNFIHWDAKSPRMCFCMSSIIFTLWEQVSDELILCD